MEQHYNSLIKKSVKQDKASWFHKILDQGNWDAIQKFRKAGKTQSSKFTVNGKTLSAHEKAEGLANHLEHVQWKRRPGTCCPDRPPIFTSMCINCEDFENEELIVALKSLKKRKATGVDDIPAEFWQVCLDSEDLLQELLKFINLVWQTCEIPKQ